MRCFPTFQHLLPPRLALTTAKDLQGAYPKPSCRALRGGRGRGSRLDNQPGPWISSKCGRRPRQPEALRSPAHSGLIVHAALCRLAAMTVKDPQSCPNYTLLLQAAKRVLSHCSDLVQPLSWEGEQPGVCRWPREFTEPADTQQDRQIAHLGTLTWSLPRSGSAWTRRSGSGLFSKNSLYDSWANT